MDSTRSQKGKDNKEKRKEYLRQYTAKRRKSETAEEREKRLLNLRQYAAKRRKSETAEEREKRLSILKAYRDNMKPDKREDMLQRKAEYSYNKYHSLSDEQWEELSNDRHFKYWENMGNLTDVELKAKEEENRQRVAKWRKGLSKEVKRKMK